MRSQSDVPQGVAFPRGLSDHETDAQLTQPVVMVYVAQTRLPHSEQYLSVPKMSSDLIVARQRLMSCRKRQEICDQLWRNVRLLGLVGANCDPPRKRNHEAHRFQ